MNKKLEETFNLPPIEDILHDEIEDENEMTLEEAEHAIAEYKGQLSLAERTDAALPFVQGLEDLDREMDEYAKNAIDTFDELCTLGKTVEDRHAAPIYDSASKMLQAALQAKQAKMDKKLKMLELQMRQRKLDMEEKKLEAYLKSKEQEEEDGAETHTEGRIIGDRTALIKEMMDQLKK